MARIRVKRVESLIREEVAEFILREISDPRVGFVTVTKVECTSDLARAKVFVSVLGDEGQKRTTMRGLERAKKIIRARVGKVLGIRRVPELVFELDEGIEKQLRMAELIDEARSSDPHHDESAGDEDATDEDEPAAPEDDAASA
jgi:ribosome-binding factor A